MRAYYGYESVDWYYWGVKTAEDMRGDPRFDGLFRETCVLYDDVDGRVYSFEPLSTVAARYAIPTGRAAEDVLADVQAVIDGTYKAPGVAEAQATADEAKATADTAAASMNEYMDALLGLNTTDETEATDAE